MSGAEPLLGTPVDGTVVELNIEGEIKEAVVSAQSVVHWVSTSSTTKDVYLLGETETRGDTEAADFKYFFFQARNVVWVTVKV